MRHSDHVALIRDAVRPDEVWADLGSGEGAFTLALADLVGERGHIYSVERDASALEVQRDAMDRRFPRVPIDHVRGDFTKELVLPPLDGIVMANSLHFYRDKETVLPRVLGHLKGRGRFVLVEYDADRGNAWVPYPISFATWETLSARVGLAETRLMTRVPSRFLGAIYSAVSLRSA